MPWIIRRAPHGQHDLEVVVMIRLNGEVLKSSVRTLGIAAIATLACACSQTNEAPVKSNTTILSQHQSTDMEEVVIVASRNRVASVTE
jgi:hypothetical protein